MSMSMRSAIPPLLIVNYLKMIQEVDQENGFQALLGRLLLVVN